MTYKTVSPDVSVTSHRFTKEAEYWQKKFSDYKEFRGQAGIALR